MREGPGRRASEGSRRTLDCDMGEHETRLAVGEG